MTASDLPVLDCRFWHNSCEPSRRQARRAFPVNCRATSFPMVRDTLAIAREPRNSRRARFASA